MKTYNVDMITTKQDGFGLIHTANIMRGSAWPKPEALPGIALPPVLRRWTLARSKNPANLVEGPHS
jgi:hypothetical protein